MILSRHGYQHDFSAQWTLYVLAESAHALPATSLSREVEGFGRDGNFGLSSADRAVQKPNSAVHK